MLCSDIRCVWWQQNRGDIAGAYFFLEDSSANKCSKIRKRWGHWSNASTLGDNCYSNVVNVSCGKKHAGDCMHLLQLSRPSVHIQLPSSASGFSRVSLKARLRICSYSAKEAGDRSSKAWKWIKTGWSVSSLQSRYEKLWICVRSNLGTSMMSSLMNCY